MMDASDPRTSDELSDDQLDALLASADEDLLQHIQAGADPNAVLAGLMSIQGGAEADPYSSASVDAAGDLRLRARGRRGGPRRSWAPVCGSVAAAAVVALAIAFSAGSFALAPVAVPPAATHPGAAASVQSGHMALPRPSPSPRGAPENQIVYSATLLFDSDQSELSASAEAQLRTLLEAKGTYLFRQEKPASISVAIYGYADDRRGPVYQRSLSWERALAVRNWLITHHVAASELHAAGHGDAVADDQAVSPSGNRVTVIMTIRLPRLPKTLRVTGFVSVEAGPVTVPGTRPRDRTT
jgi:outer membrane protein OmpA-like peptidoglycan-associated protein